MAVMFKVERLLEILEEIYPQKKWVTVSLEKIDPDTLDELWKMYIRSYFYTGFTVRTKREFQNKKNRILQLVNTDSDALPDAFLVLQKIPQGEVIKLCGSDGGEESGKFLKEKMVDLLKTKGYFAGVCGKAEGFLRKTGVPIVKDGADIVANLSKGLTWIGDGVYEKELNIGKTVKKVLFGTV